MNLLGIQDVLKNASDQQLMQLMRSPDSTAPSYLVLSELSRRKEMRSKQAQPPQGTVAQDLTKDDSTYADQQGIRSLRMPGYEYEAQAAETNPDEGIEALREGGIVRMSGGGSSPRPIGELPREDVLEYLQSLRFGPGPGGIRSPYSESDLRTRLDEITMGQRAPLIAQSAGDPNNTVPIPGLNYEAGAFIAPGQPPASFTPPLAAAPPPVTTPPVTTPPVTTPPVTTPPVTTTTTGTTPAAGNRPAGTNTTAGAPASSRAPAGGGGPAPASSIRALTPGEERPNMQSIMDRNLQMIPGIPQELLDRIKSSRTNEGDRRREAQNMALIEAGLRIASSNNPRLGAAIAEGAAPAVQSYGQQLGQIRQDQRADLQTDLATAEADVRRRYMAGQISASEYRTRLTELGAMERTLVQERGQDARSRATLGSASADRAAARTAAIEARIAKGEVTPQEYARMSEPEKQAFREIQQLNNPQRGADVSGLSPVVATLTPAITAIRTRMETLGQRPPDTIGIFGSANPRAAQWDREMKALRDELTPLEAARNRALNGVVAPRVNGPRVPGAGTPPPPSGYEIQQ